MEKFPPATRAHMYARYKAAYHCTDEEAAELYDYDTNHCGTDDDAKDYLLNTVHVPAAKVKELFTKSSPKAINASELKVNREVAQQTKAAQSDRLKFIQEQLISEYGFLFGEIISATDSVVEFKLPDGNGASIKIAKHKTPKVVTKEIKRRVARDREGNVEAISLTDVDYRCLALENVLRERPDLFVALSTAGSQFGFSTFNPKYPFGSVKLTHHKVS